MNERELASTIAGLWRWVAGLAFCCVLLSLAILLPGYRFWLGLAAAGTLLVTCVIHLSADQPEPDENPGSSCLRCGADLATGSDTCSECGWSYDTEATG